MKGWIRSSQKGSDTGKAGIRRKSNFIQLLWVFLRPEHVHFCQSTVSSECFGPKSRTFYTVVLGRPCCFYVQRSVRALSLAVKWNWNLSESRSMLCSKIDQWRKIEIRRSILWSRNWKYDIHLLLLLCLCGCLLFCCCLLPFSIFFPVYILIIICVPKQTFWLACLYFTILLSMAQLILTLA